MRSFRLIIGSCLILLGLLMAAYGAYLALTPPVYQSTVRIKIEKDSNDITGPGFSESGFDPYWVQNEFEKIQSKVILFSVITNLNLQRAWAGKLKREEVSVAEIYVMLKQQMEVRQARNSSLIEITVKSEDPAEAANIANAIAVEYSRYQMASKRELIARGMKTYERELERQNQAILALEARVGQTSESLNMTNAMSRDLETLKAARDRLNLRMAQEISALNTLKSGVEVIDPAKAAGKPTFPNRGIISISFIVGVLVAVAGILLIRANHDDA